jgi:hypothetical protein
MVKQMANNGLVFNEALLGVSPELLYVGAKVRLGPRREYSRLRVHGIGWDARNLSDPISKQLWVIHAGRAQEDKKP